MLSRRRFLQLAGASALGAWLPALPHDQDLPTSSPSSAVLYIGRAVDYAGLFERPSYSSTKVGAFSFDNLLPIYEELEAEGGYNRTWYRTEGGYVHSANIVPMRPYTDPPPLVTEVGEWGVWAMVIAPWSDCRRAPDPQAETVFRLYHDSVHRVTAVQQAADGEWWYEIHNPRYNRFYWAQAAHLRVIAPEEIAPIRPEVEDKRIDINLAAQVLIAYEGNTEVFRTRVATGNTFQREDGTVDYFETPPGAYRVMLKAPSRHMGSSGTLGGFDYPGVPWCVFFTDDGLAIHGTYWHNDYGAKRSHGCVNARPDDALWIFRWTSPEMPYEAETLPTAYEPATTPVYVF